MEETVSRLGKFDNDSSGVTFCSHFTPYYNRTSFVAYGLEAHFLQTSLSNLPSRAQVSIMNTNEAPQVPEEMQSDAGRVSVVLIQHWATMVNALRDELEVTRAQLRTIEDRAGRQYRDIIHIHGLFNESEAELHYHRQVNARLEDLIEQIFVENPQLEETHWRALDAIVIGTAWNPIDLTTDEEIDEFEL